MIFGNKTDKTEITLKSQLWNVFFSHIKTILMIFIIFFGFFFSLWTIKILDKIMGVLMLVVYALSIASAANKCAAQDKRSYAKTKAYSAKGLLLAVSIVLSNIFFIAFWKTIYIVGSDIASLIGQIIFVAWSLPYNSFLALNGAEASYTGLVLMLIIPLISAGVGYFAGYRNFDLYAWLDKLTYEKKKN